MGGSTGITWPEPPVLPLPDEFEPDVAIGAGVGGSITASFTNPRPLIDRIFEREGSLAATGVGDTGGPKFGFTETKLALKNPSTDVVDPGAMHPEARTDVARATAP